MNLRTRLSRSNGYRELGMYDESILILEDIPFEEGRWHPLVVEARYNTYRDPNSRRFGEGEAVVKLCYGQFIKIGMDINNSFNSPH